MRKYLAIKNTIIAMLLTVMYLRCLVEGLSAVKIALGCVAMFIALMALLKKADNCYMRALDEKEAT